MSKLLLGFGVALILPACGRAPDPDPRPVHVSPEALLRAYKDAPGHEVYTNQLIRVSLPVKGYDVRPGALTVSTGLPGAPPVLVFETASPPPDNLRAVEITGTCRGRVVDGIRRGQGVDWYLRVENCSVVIR